MAYLFTCEQEIDLDRIPFPHYKPKNEYVIGLEIKSSPKSQNKMQDALLSKYPILKDKSYFLFLSRVDYKKGIDLLIEAFATTVKTNFENVSDIPLLVIAAPGLNTTYGKTIQTVVNSDEKLLPKIVFTGMITGDIKWGSLYGCEAFILPSHQENFGIAK